MDTLVERADPNLLPPDADTVVDETEEEEAPIEQAELAPGAGEDVPSSEEEAADATDAPEPAEAEQASEPTSPEPSEPEPSEPEPEPEPEPSAAEPEPETQSEPEPPAAESEPAAAEVPTGKPDAQASDAVDINSASAGELEALQGIGPILAARIVAHRKANGPFSSVEELSKVKGVGPSMLAGFRDNAVALPAD